MLLGLETWKLRAYQSKVNDQSCSNYYIRLIGCQVIRFYALDH